MHCETFWLKIRQIRGTPNLRHLSGSPRLEIEPLSPARAKPLIFSRFCASSAGVMGPDPSPFAECPLPRWRYGFCVVRSRCGTCRMAGGRTRQSLVLYSTRDAATLRLLQWFHPIPTSDLILLAHAGIGPCGFSISLTSIDSLIPGGIAYITAARFQDYG